MVPDRRHGGHRRVLAAALGCLILGLWGEDAQAEGRAPVAEHGPTEKSESDRGARHDQEPVLKPTWPATIEGAEEASRAECGTPEECRAEQREYADLRAQWQAARAAARQEAAAVAQTYLATGAFLIAAVGTVLLISTLWETRRAAKAAEDAVKVTSETAERQLRAYVFPAGARIEGFRQRETRVIVAFKNTGQTPAYKVRHVLRWMIAGNGRADFNLSAFRHNGSPPIGAGDGIRHTLDVSHEEFDKNSVALIAGTLKFFLYGEMIYLDYLGVQRRTPFRFYLWCTEGLADGELLVCEDGNEPD